MTDVSINDDGQIDVSVIMDTFNEKVTPQIEASLTDLRGILASNTAAIGVQKDAINAAADAQIEMNMIQAKADKKLRADNANVAAAFGVNPDAASYVLTQMGADILATQKELKLRDTAIQKKMDQGFMADPLQWIANQFSLPSDVMAYNARLDGQQQQLTVAQQLMSRSTEAFTVNSVIDATNTEDKLDTLNKLELAKAAAAVAQSEERLGALGLNVINVRTRLTNEQFSSMVQLNSVFAQREMLLLNRAEGVRADRRLTLSEAQAAREKRRSEIDEENRTLMLEERKDNAQAREALQTKLNTATDALGMSRVQFKEFQLMSGPMKAALESFMTDPDLQEGRLGYNAADALEKVNLMNAPLTPGMNVVRNKLLVIKDATAAGDVQWGTRKPAEQTQVVQQKIKETINLERNNIKDEGGVYSPPSLKAVVTNPNLAGLGIVEDLVPLAKANDQYPTRAQNVFDAAMRRIIDGKASPAQAAAEVSKIYDTIMIQNNETFQYSRMALPQMSKATGGFKTSVFITGGWGGSKSIDMSNPAAVEAALTRAAVADALSKQQHDYFMQNPGAR